ncbi:MAG: hypothetical protein EBY55_02060 [Gammaproteobacteria bacterium]|nr:hypothetical protein [Gammaproteobacteria bacterium]
MSFSLFSVWSSPNALEGREYGALLFARSDAELFSFPLISAHRTVMPNSILRHLPKRRGL